MLKSKQTRVVYRDNQHIRIVHPYACLMSTTLAVLVNGSMYIVVSHSLMSLKKQGHYYDLYYNQVCTLYLLRLLSWHVETEEGNSNFKLYQ